MRSLYCLVALIITSFAFAFEPQNPLIRKSGSVPLVIGHQGAAEYAPGNTAPSIALAREYGVDYVETDVQQTSDGQLVIFHDTDLTSRTDVAQKFRPRPKMIDGHNSPYFIGHFTLAEIKTLDAGTWFNKESKAYARPSFSDPRNPIRILTVDEFLDVMEYPYYGNIPGLYIELKNSDLYPGIAGKLMSTLASRQWLGHFPNGLPKTVIETFEENSVKELKQGMLKKRWPFAPIIFLVVAGPVGIYEDMMSHHKHMRTPEYAKKIGADGIGPPFTKGILKGYVERAHRLGLFVNFWTNNSRLHSLIERSWSYKLLINSPADGFFTDRPDVMQEIWYKKHDRPLPSKLLNTIDGTWNAAIRNHEDSK